jgi:hypothetical protein
MGYIHNPIDISENCVAQHKTSSTTIVKIVSVQRNLSDCVNKPFYSFRRKFMAAQDSDLCLPVSRQPVDNVFGTTGGSRSCKLCLAIFSSNSDPGQHLETHHSEEVS